jgi:hypothetical protein
MTAAALDGLLDETLGAMTRMRPDEIEAAEARLATAFTGVPDAGTVLEFRLKFEQLRAAALQAAQLWHACLPEDRLTISYSSDGLVSTSENEAKLSVTG